MNTRHLFLVGYDICENSARRRALRDVQHHALGSTMGLFAHIDLHHATNLPEPDQLSAWAVRHYEKHAPHWQQRLGQVLFDFERFLRAHWL